MAGSVMPAALLATMLTAGCFAAGHGAHAGDDALLTYPGDIVADFPFEYAWHSQDEASGWLMVSVNTTADTVVSQSVERHTSSEERVLWHRSGRIGWTHDRLAELTGGSGPESVGSTCSRADLARSVADCPAIASKFDGKARGSTTTLPPGRHVFYLADFGAAGGLVIRLRSDNPLDFGWMDEGRSEVLVLAPAAGTPTGPVALAGAWQADEGSLAFFAALGGFTFGTAEVQAADGTTSTVDAWGPPLADAVAGRGAANVTVEGTWDTGEPVGGALVGLLRGTRLVLANGTLDPFGAPGERGPPPSAISTETDSPP